MSTEANGTKFIIWGVDEAAYGPVDLPMLVSWIKDERVLADTWIFAQRDGNWRRATDFTELQMFFRSKSPAPNHAAAQRA